MNICLVSREYPTDDHMGGIGTYTEQTARALAERGQPVTVITEATAQPTARVEHDVRVIRLPRSSGRLRTLQRAFAVSRAVMRLPEPPDIVQVCEYRAEGAGLVLRRPRQTKLVTRLATPTFLVRRLNNQTQSLPLARRVGEGVAYYEPLERWQTRRSDGIIAITDAIGEVVSDAWRIPRRRMVTIRNSVDFSARFAGEPAPLPSELSGIDYLLYFGRLEERKGVHILARALPDILAQHPNLHMVFAGDNVLTYQGVTLEEYVKRLNAANAARLHFLPRLPHRQLYPLISHARLAVLPSLWEGLGNVSLEALDCGTPVVATLGCGFSEVIEDGESGLLVPPGDPTALASAALTLLADPSRLARMRSSARARAREFHSDRMTQALLDFYESLIRPRSRQLRAGAPGAA